ncbi:MAG: HAD-IA family hydrolase [Tannerellaceae bacterium]|jgi:HAD superfamily hydrolase (TIGR01509 family)|nr:HAD-IA family hydrolase [Tannerellaceae bacterium]
MTELRAVLFDMDGVLYDSMSAHVRAWSEVAAAHGLAAADDDFYLFEGKTGEGTIDELFLRTRHRHATPDELRSVYREKSALFERYHMRRQPMCGAIDVLRCVKAAGLQTLVVTGSAQHSLIDALEEDFPGHFRPEGIVTAYDVVHGKPHPEPYLIGLRKAAVSAAQAIVVENAPLGIQAAVAAGIYTVAVNTGPLADDILLAAGANRLYPDMPSLAADMPSLIRHFGLPHHKS